MVANSTAAMAICNFALVILLFSDERKVMFKILQRWWSWVCILGTSCLLKSCSRKLDHESLMVPWCRFQCGKRNMLSTQKELWIVNNCVSLHTAQSRTELICLKWPVTHMARQSVGERCSVSPLFATAHSRRPNTNGTLMAFNMATFPTSSLFSTDRTASMTSSLWGESRS